MRRIQTHAAMASLRPPDDFGELVLVGAVDSAWTRYPLQGGRPPARGLHWSDDVRLLARAGLSVGRALELVDTVMRNDRVRPSAKWSSFIHAGWRAVRAHAEASRP